MNKLNMIGLNSERSLELSKKLNNLLANYSIFYQNVRGYHWNIKGDKFFELHVKFEELYDDLIIKIDDIAERILTLGETPEHSYSNYLKIAEILESNQEKDGLSAVRNILESLRTLIIKQREIMALSNEIDDEGTSAQMSDNIREQEKLVWMYSSLLGK